MDLDEKIEKTERSPLLSSSSSLDNSVFRSNSENPAEVSRLRTYVVTKLLLFAVLCERATYYGILANLVMFCTNYLGYSTTSAVTINLIFTALAYFFPLVGGRIADTISGRFNTIYGGLLIYIVGMVLLPTVAFNYGETFGSDKNGLRYGLPLNFKRGYFLSGLLLCSIGIGFFKANASALGAQQVESLGKNAVHSFFNWYYWFMRVGSCVACVVIVYIQQEIDFFIGYVIPLVVLAFAMFFFFIPRNFYLEHKKGSVAGTVVGILWQATANKFCRKNASSERIRHFLDSAKSSKGGNFPDEEVDHLKYAIKTVPVFSTLILFSTFTSQNTTTMLLQGERMDVTLGSYSIPAASLNAVTMIIIAFLIPILDLFIYPLLNHFNRSPTMLQRIGFGMLLGVLCLVCMGVLEIFRKNDVAVSGGNMQMVGTIVYSSSRISILWQIPQFVLSGIAEVFTMATALEFAYTEAPVEMQGLAMGVKYLTTCLGHLLGSILYVVVANITAQTGSPWLPDEINDGHLDRFAFLLAGILFANFIIFVIIARNYRYCRLGTQQPLIPRSRIDQPSKTFAESPTD